MCGQVRWGGPNRPIGIRTAPSFVSPLIPIAITILLVATCGPVFAGTICGLVRDAVTAGPVDRAGVFVHDPSGGYTGHHGVTDATGAFCIDGVPDGTYDLSVQVDDYQIAWVTGVVVEDVPSDVVVDAVLSPVWLWPPWPNPAQGHVNIRLRSKLAEPLTLAVYDAAGRFVRGWQTNAGDGGERTLAWDGRDRMGNRVSSGSYFVLLKSTGVSLTRRVQVLR